MEIRLIERMPEYQCSRRSFPETEEGSWPLEFSLNGHDRVGNPPSISKEFLEPLRRQGRVPRRVLDIAMPEIGLDRTGVVAIVGELVAAAVPRPCRPLNSVAPDN